MSTPAIIAVTPGTGILLDAVSLVVGANTVVRETMVIADPSNPTRLANVTAAGALQVDGSAALQPVSTIGQTIAVTNAGVFAVQDSAAEGYLGTIAGAISASTMTVTGTVTANIGTTNGLALDSSLSTIDADIKSNITLHAGTNLIGKVEVSDGTNVLFTVGNPGYVQGTISIGSGPFAVTQSTSPWIVAGGGTAGSPGTAVLTVQGISGGQAVPVSGTFYQTTQPVSIASGQVASGAFASGSIASGAIASGAAVSGAFADGSLVTLGAESDAKNSATDNTAVTIMSVLKEISYMAQNPAAVSATNNIANVSAVVNAANSSTSALNAGVSFTGTVVDLISVMYTAIQVQLLTDQNGILKIQFSTDNSHWDHTVSGLVTANESTSLSTGIHGRYMRVMMTNTSASNQTFLRLQTLLVPIPVQPTIKDLDTAVGNDDNAMVTHTVITGIVRSAAGSFENVEVSPSGALLIATEGSVLGDTVTTARRNQIEINFSSSDATDATLITNTTSGTGAITQANGEALYSTGTGAAGEAQGVTVASIRYRPANDIYAEFTAAFTTPTDATAANDYQRVGVYDTNNGLFIGYEGTAFGVTIRRATVDTRVLLANFNLDPLDGSADSDFTRAGVPEAVDFTKLNIFRIRFAWFGAGPVFFDIFTPDGAWLPFQMVRNPNLSNTPYIATPNLPLTIDAFKTSSDSTNLQIRLGCMAAGVTESAIRLSDPMVNSTLAIPTRSILVGQNPSGSYTNVGVDVTGSLSIGTITAETNSATSAAWTHATAGNTTLVASAIGFANATFGFSLSGGVIASGVIQFEGTVDGTNWIALSVEPIAGQTNPVTSYSLAAAANNIWQTFIGGLYQVRIRLSTGISISSGSPVATVWIRPSFATTEPTGLVFQPTGSNLHVVVDSPLPSLAAGSQIIGQIKLVDGPGSVNQAMVKAASTQSASTDTSLVVQINPNQPNLSTALNVSASIAAAQTLATVTTVSTVTTVTNPVSTRPASPTTSTWSQAAISFSGSGANILVAGVGGQTVRIMRLFIVNSDAATATNITIQDTTPTSFSGAFRLASGGSWSGDGAGDPLYTTATGKGFQLNSSVAVQISGTVWYTQS